MSHTIPVEEAEGRLRKLISQLLPGEEITLLSDNEPIARIIPQTRPRRRQSGTLKGMLTVISEDDEHLDDFKEYME